MGSGFSTSSLTLVIFYFSDSSHLSECEVVSLDIVLWISNSLVTNDVKHTFVCFLVICISSFEKHLFNSVAHFFN